MKNLIFILLVFNLSLFSQSYRSIKSTLYPDTEHLVTISKNASVNQAIEILSKISKQAINKIIVLDKEIPASVGIEITNLNWYKALEIISRLHNLEIVEREDFIKLVPSQNLSMEEVPEILKGVHFNTREVTISAIFFELDVNKAKERGINWRTLFSKRGSDVGIRFGEPSKDIFDWNSSSESKALEIGAGGEINFLGTIAKATTLFSFLESNQLGEVIASPQITVRDRVKGEIQVGSDFSTREKDFAGNTIERFYSTGTIIRVTPYVLKENNRNYILLDLNVERSSAIPGQISTEIKKTKANTNVLLLDGEETVIGGLFINEEKKERTGIPILKDLPWWVFGIKYLTGRDVVTTSRKELIIVLKAQLNPSLYERITERENLLIEKKLDEYDNQIEKIKSQSKIK
ncbi:MAG: type II and III secretion system protein [Ignavibacteria bacterium]|nr:type II and III secretion system protein [Ignavibacteria bacterium]